MSGGEPSPLLALETATRSLSVAVLRGGECVAEETATAGRSAAEVLLPAIDRLLDRAGLDPGGLGGFAISVGPGSFTGLRVGIATLKGLAFGSDIPVAAVSTLAALARGAPEGEGPVVALLDARRGEVYAAAFRARGAEPDPRLPEGVYTPAELAARLDAGCVLVGEEAERRARALRDRGLEVRVSAARLEAPRARDVGALGILCLARGGGVAVEALVPRYLRRADAEVARTGQRFEAPARTAADPGPGGDPL